jgi:imidazolonepropionase-like amidohydrolase
MKKDKLYIILLLVFTVFISNYTRAQIPAKSQDHPIALIGGIIHTVSGDIVENGNIIFDKGKIIAIGKDIVIPPGTEQINVKGKHVFPGMIDAASTIGLSEIGSIRATIDYSETGKFNPNVKTEVAINPESEVIPVTRSNGITTALIVPSGGVICGTSSLITLDGWSWEDLTLKAPVGMHINWPGRTSGRRNIMIRLSEEDQKRERDNQIKEIVEFFDQARAYLIAKNAEGKKDIPHHDIDVRYESMIPVIENKIPLIIRANDLSEIESAIAWSKQENLKIIIMGGRDTWKIAKLLKDKDIPVIVNPILTLPAREWEGYDTPFSIADKLFKEGVKFCIAAEGGTTNERNLPYHAAMASAYGLPKAEALKSVTLYPAQILGVGDRMGSLEVGKDATIIVADGDILEIKTNIEREFILGKDIDLTNKHTRLNEKYKEKYRRMGFIK